MTLGGLFTGHSTIVTGVEDDPETGFLRMYVGPRYKGIYALIEDPRDQQTLREAWADTSVHVVVPTPDPDQLFGGEQP